MKRITALILIVISLLTFAACSEKETALNSSGAIIAGDTKLDGAAYYSELYSYKNDFLFNYLGLAEDNEAIWSQDSPSGRTETVGETLSRMALEDMVQFAWVVEYAKDNGAVLDEEDMAMLEEGYQNLKDSLETEEKYQEYLTTLKFTDETIREYLEQTLYYDKGFALLISENGLYPVADEEYDKYYEDNFYTVKHIFVNNVSKEDEDGNAVALTEEEAKAQTEKADKIYSDLEGGLSFDTLFILSEDGMQSSYPDGLTFTEGMIDSAYEEAAKKLEIGEYTKVNGTNGGIYIILRMELSEADREEYDEYIRSAVHSEIQTKIYTDHKKEVDVNYDIINSYKIADIPVAGE